MINFEVYYTNDERRMKFFKSEKEAKKFALNLIKESDDLQEITINKSGLKASLFSVVYFWAKKGSNLDNLAKKDSILASKRIQLKEV